MELSEKKMKRYCSCQGEGLIVPAVSQGLWSSNKMKKLNVTKKIDFFKYLRVFVKIILHTPYKKQSDSFCS